MKKKKILTIITLILFIIVFILAYLLFQKYILKINFENSVLPFASKNEKNIFKVNKIVLFSNCDAKNKTASSTNFTIENLYQYTDIAIFIDSPAQEKTLENTLKSVSIKNINFSTPPSLGEPKLYFKGLSSFAKSDLVEENLIKDSLDFTITSEDETNLDTPVLYNNLANPLTISYVNTNIKSDYTITDTSVPITYDGSLLKRCNVSLEDIKCNFSFDIYITNNLDQEFKTTVFIDIPLETDEKSIYDGSIQLEKDTNLVVTEKIMTHGKQFAITEFEVELNGENASTHVTSRSVAVENSKQEFISKVYGNTKCFAHVECDAIIKDKGIVKASPEITANNVDANLIHEAAIGKIAGEQLIKLMTLGLTEKEAEEEIINGFLR